MRFTITTFWLISVLLFSCKQENNLHDKEIVTTLKLADSLFLAHKGDSAKLLLPKIRTKISLSNPLICDYYCYMAQISYGKPDSVNLYADSAITFFKDEDRKKQYPKQYFKSLLTKGDAYIFNKQYNSALKYYYNAKKVFKTGNCEDGYLSTKMAGIYYNQRNFKLAAKYWAESARLLSGCNEVMSFQKLFYSQQGALNNSGISYEKAGQLDSALYYYMQDVKLINDIERQDKDKTVDVNGARIVVYDNLGGLYLKKGNLKLAEDYLNKCIAIPSTEVDGIKIPPNIKLVKLYLAKGNYPKALAALNESRRILNKFPGSNLDLEIIWNKLYSQYLFKQGQPARAYEYQSLYINMRDSLEDTSSNLYKLDVNRELNIIFQQQVLDDLEHKNRVKKLYIAGILIVAIMAFVIILLINRNLKKSKKNNLATTQHNEKLQQTLAELERVNQNYIRIMRVMAHDLRNPLSGMTGLATMLLDEDEFSDDNKHMLQLIETTGIHSMEMISELLKSGLADENEPIAVQTLDLKSLLYDSVELLQFKAIEKNQRIVFESEDTPVMANVNHEKIWRVFNNLIVNAIKFSHENGVIQVGISHDEQHILVSVADNGIGIPEKNKDSIFEMFTPAKRVGTNGEQPFGLGLSISKKLIEKHHGKIWFESNPNVGTVFYIELPYVNGLYADTRSNI